MQLLRIVGLAAKTPIYIYILLARRRYVESFELNVDACKNTMHRVSRNAIGWIEYSPSLYSFDDCVDHVSET